MKARVIILVHDTSSHHAFQVIGWTRNCMENNQREITPKI